MKILEIASRNKFCFVPVLLISAAVAKPHKATPATPDTPRFVIDASRGYLLGASKGGRWVKAKIARQWLRGGEKYTLYDANRVVGTATGGKADLQGAPCEETYFVPMKGAATKRVSSIALSNSASRPLRPVSELSASQPVYRAEVMKWLRAHGLKNPSVNIVKIWRADLDGDGTNEVLISAVRHQGKAGPVGNMSPNATAGDYSVLLLRRVTKKGVQTVAMDSQIYPQAKTFSAPTIHELMSLLDLNGDGRLEIVVRGRYYEGDWTSVYEYLNGAAREVIGAGCGA